MNRQMTVSQLSKYIKGVFEDEELLHDITLSGEVAEVSYSDKHTFIVLSDGAFSVRCVHFMSRDRIEKGAFIAVKGSVNYYDKRNSVTFTYTEFFLQGVGDKNARLVQLKQKLRDLGYFENRPQLPKYIVNVAVVTSPDGAAIRDFVRVVHDKNPFVSISIYPVKVQGEGAAAMICNAIDRLGSRKTDAIVLCRGGGSDEDLDTFNDEKLAVAVANSRIPIISAVGHEIDYTLCDYCAGTRAGTPSIAGEIVNEHASRILTDIITCVAAARDAVQNKYRRGVLRVNRLGKATTYAVSYRINCGYSIIHIAASQMSSRVDNKLTTHTRKLSDSAARLKNAVALKYTVGHNKVEKLSALLNALDPHRIIKIGYAAVLKKGRRISGVAGLSPNDDINVIFSDGTVMARVVNIEQNAKA